MVNGLLLRPYVSGLVWNMKKENLQLMQEGIALYKEIRKELPGMLPFWPKGLHTVHCETLAYGLKNDRRAYLAVFAPKSDQVTVDLSESGISENARVRVIYPSSIDCSYELEGGILDVKLPGKKCARLLEIVL